MLIYPTNRSPTNIHCISQRHGFRTLIISLVSVLTIHHYSSPSLILFADASSEQKIVEVDAMGQTTTISSSSSSSFLSNLPPLGVLKYGTAWKKDRTADLVRMAIHAGFRHIDTACQPKHYNEAGVGNGIKVASSELGLHRSDLWIQTKYTSISGQDPNTIPYNQNAILEDQVKQSLQISLQNLQTNYIDSLIMHSPEETWEKTLRVWAVLESFVKDGIVKQIGISNAWDSDFVKYLYHKATIKPSIVQQRFHAGSGEKYEVAMRKFCIENNIEFQSFWTLGANQHALQNETVRQLARLKNLSPETLLYAFCLSIGITVLDGTTSEQHMVEDIALFNKMKNGVETVFNHPNEITVIAEALGIPDWRI